MKNILFFGDSLTAGYGLRNAAAESFPALIGQRIAAAGLSYHIINAGVSGDTTAGGLKRIDYWLSQPIGILVLELGINDAIRGINTAVIQFNLQAIIDRVRGKYPQVKIVLMGMQIPTFIHAKLAEDFKAVFENINAKNKLAFVPFFLEGVAGKHRLNLPDRLHPNAEGYQLIAENTWPVIKALL